MMLMEWKLNFENADIGAEFEQNNATRQGRMLLVKIYTVEPLLYDHPQNHIGVVA